MVVTEGLSRPDLSNKEQKQREVFRVEVKNLVRPFSRKAINRAALNALAKSMLAEGQKEPIHIAPGNVLLSGDMRSESAIMLVAAGHTQFEYLDAVLFPELTTYELQLKHVMTCDTKSNRNPLDTAFLIADAEQKLGITTGKELAARLGFSEAFLSRYRKLLRHEADIQQLVKDGKLTIQHLIAADKFPIDKARELLLKSVGLTVKEMQASVTKPRKPKTLHFEHGSLKLSWEYTAFANQPQLLEAVNELLKKVKNLPNSIDLKTIGLETFLREMNKEIVDVTVNGGAS